MGFAEIVELIKGVLQFPATVLQFIQILKKTPEENHDNILKSIQKESQKFKNEGRPTW